MPCKETCITNCSTSYLQYLQKPKYKQSFLIGVSPGGLCSYVSDAYGGSTSNRQIVKRSRLPEKCDRGDSIMSDKGFDVQDIFAPYGVTVNILTFFRKKNQMSGETVIRDRKIASKRVHVERFIGLGKTYLILSQPFNTSETQLSSDIIFVCCMLIVQFPFWNCSTSCINTSSKYLVVILSSTFFHEQNSLFLNYYETFCVVKILSLLKIFKKRDPNQ